MHTSQSSGADERSPPPLRDAREPRDVTLARLFVYTHALDMTAVQRTSCPTEPSARRRAAERCGQRPLRTGFPVSARTCAMPAAKGRLLPLSTLPSTYMVAQCITFPWNDAKVDTLRHGARSYRSSRHKMKGGSLARRPSRPHCYHEGEAVGRAAAAPTPNAGCALKLQAADAARVSRSAVSASRSHPVDNRLRARPCRTRTPRTRVAEIERLRHSLQRREPRRSARGNAFFANP